MHVAMIVGLFGESMELFGENMELFGECKLGWQEDGVIHYLV